MTGTRRCRSWLMILSTSKKNKVSCSGVFVYKVYFIVMSFVNIDKSLLSIHIQ